MSLLATRINAYPVTATHCHYPMRIARTDRQVVPESPGEKIVNVNMTHTPDPQASSWPDRVNLLLGLFLWLSSWLALDRGAASTWNAVILGAAIVIVAIAAIVKPAVGLEWTNVGFGVWLSIAPWALDFSADAGAVWASVLVGLFVTCFAGMQMIFLKRPVASRRSSRAR